MRGWSEVGGLSMLLEAELGQNLIGKLLKFDVVFCVGKIHPTHKKKGQTVEYWAKGFGLCHPPSLS